MLVERLDGLPDIGFDNKVTKELSVTVISDMTCVHLDGLPDKQKQPLPIRLLTQLRIWQTAV